MSLTITIGGQAVTLKEGTLKITSRVDDKDKATFTVRDDTGTLTFSKGQTVSIVDSTLGVLFSGFVNKPTMANLFPNATNEWSIDCVNQFYVPAKRVHRKQHKGQHAGPIVALQVQQYLEPDGVNGNFGLDWTEDLPTWQAGTHSGTHAGTNASTGNPGAGDLELASSGVTYHSTPTSGSVSTVNAIAFSGTASSVVANPRVSRQIWTGSIVVASNDTLTYTVWVSSTSPQIVAGLDLLFSDGTSFASTPLFDNQEDTSSDPTADLSSLASDQWYTRTFAIGAAFAGKTITSVVLVLAGSKAGTYNTYFQNILYNSTQIFGTTLNSNVPLSNIGYSNVSLSVVQAVSAPVQQIVFTPAGYSGVGIVQSSQVAWTQTVPAGTSLLIESSIDNQASWQVATSGSAIPNLIPGMLISTVNLAYRATLKVTSDPTQTTLGYANFQSVVTPAYNATKTDLVQVYGNAVSGAIGFGAGTLTNTQVTNNQLTLAGFARNYATIYGDASDQAFFGTLATHFIAGRQFEISVNHASGNDAKSRMDPAGQWQNFVLECDVQVPDASLGQACLVYRTTSWNATNNTYAYMIAVSSSTFQLGRGTNSTTNTFTNIQSVSVSLTAGSTHRIKAVVNGNSHTMYLDGVQLISQTDSTFPNAGYAGMRVYQGSSSRITALFNNFSIRPALTGTWQSAALSIASPGTYGNSVIAWDIDGIPDSSCSITMQSSIDGGSTFQSVVNGGSIPGLTAGQSLASKTLILLATLTAQSGPAVPILNGVSVFVLGAYSSTGNRTNAPLAWDSMTRLPVGSGWANASNTAAYTQVGTGATALANNEATIANTSGDVHMQLPGSSTDEDGTVRFRLSASTISAGIELRYQSSTSYYRLAATTTALGIVRNSGGGNVTLASSAVSLATGAWYRLRFRVVGSVPTLLYGRVWADGTTEPATWNVTYSDPV